MKNKRLVGLLTSIIMLVSIMCPAFAQTDTTVTTDAKTYSLGSTVEISGSADKATMFNIYYTDDDTKHVVLIDSVPAGEYTFSFRIPSSTNEDWVKGRIYTIDMGMTGDVTTTFSIKKSSGGSGGGSSSGGSSSGGSSATTAPSETASPSETTTPSASSQPSSAPGKTVSDTKGTLDTDKGSVSVKDSSLSGKAVETKVEKVSDTSFKVGVTVDGQEQTSVGRNSLVVKVPYTPDASVDTSNLVVVDKDGNIVPVAMYINGEIVMAGSAAGEYTIKEASASYSDVTQDWAKVAVSALAVRGIINGVSDTSYEPDRDVTRAEFIKLIVEVFNVYDENAASTFNDVDSSAWYASYVGTAQALGITNGVDGVSFDPNASISREQMSTMLYRAIEALGVSMSESVTAAEFVDSNAISDYAKEAVGNMQKAGVLQGVGEGEFDPQGTCTRAQAAVAIYNTLKAYLSSL